MLERIASPVPYPCFGLEQDPAAPDCKACPARVDCAKFMCNRINRITLDKLRFEIVPEKIQRKERVSPQDDVNDVTSIYQDCHEAIFTKPGRYNYKHAKDIVSNALRAGMPVELFLLSNMLGWKLKSEEPFYAAMLTGDAAVERARLHRNACAKEYAHFSKSAILRIGKQNEDSLERDFLRSEVLAGNEIVNYKASRAGSPYTALYERRELALCPEWLAIEPHYGELVLGPYEKDQQRASNQTAAYKHRFRVLNIQSDAKRHKRHAQTLFYTRQAVLPRAIIEVIAKQGLTPIDLEMDDNTITDPFAVWWKIGLVMQHLGCLKFVERACGN